VIIGNVEIGPHSSVWPGAVVRGDFGKITIGRYTCIQDNAVIHAGDAYDGKPRYTPVRIGSYVIVGHQALIHGATIEDQAVIGGCSTVFNGARVRRGAIVGLGAVVLRNAVVPPKTIVVGVPARPLRAVTSKEYENIKKQALNYAELAKRYR
jgi:carbonic anhydrase/acetyltransferase-like protein (isoleucine patch superfamily)